jgi:hypothetical protein
MKIAGQVGQVGQLADNQAKFMTNFMTNLDIMTNLNDEIKEISTKNI